MVYYTEFIKPFIPLDNLILKTSVSALISACISHVLATPSENIRIYRIAHSNYQISAKDLIKELWKSKILFRGYSARAISLGIQAAFSLSFADWMSSRTHK